MGGRGGEGDVSVLGTPAGRLPLLLFSCDSDAKLNVVELLTLCQPCLTGFVDSVDTLSALFD